MSARLSTADDSRPLFDSLEPRLLLTGLPLTMTSAEAESFAFFHSDGEVHDSLYQMAYMDRTDDIDSYIFAADANWGGAFDFSVTMVDNPASRPVAAIYDGATGTRLQYIYNPNGTSVSWTEPSMTATTEYVLAVADWESYVGVNIDITIDTPGSQVPTAVSLDSEGDGSVTTFTIGSNDTDFFQFVAPVDTNGDAEVTVAADAGSVLTPAVAIFDGAGDMIKRASTTIAGGSLVVSLWGLTPGATYYASVMSTDHATAGAYDINVDFDLIVPDTMGTVPRMVQALNYAGDGSVYHGGVSDWRGWLFASDQSLSNNTLFTVTGGPGDVPIAGLYNADTGERLALNSNPGDLSTVDFTFDMPQWTRYQFVVKDKYGTGNFTLSVDGPYQGHAGIPVLDADGDASVSLDLAVPADVDYVGLYAPDHAAGGLTVTLHDAAPTLGSAMWLFDPAGEPVASEYAATPGGDVVLTYVGVQPGATYDLAVASHGFNFGSGVYTLDIDFTTSVPGVLTSAESFAYFNQLGDSPDAQNVDASLGYPGDLDSYYFAGDTGWDGTYEFVATGLGGTVDPVLAVYDATTGVMLGFDDDSGTGDQAMLSIGGMSALHRYIVLVADQSGMGTGNVSLEIQTPGSAGGYYIGLDANGDGAAAGQYIQTNDTDIFRFIAPADTDGVLRVTVTPDATLDAAVALFDAAGDRLAWSHTEGTGGAELVAKAGLIPGGTYYVAVLANNYATTGYFDISVNFDQVVPETYPGPGHMWVTPNVNGDRSLPRTVISPGDWMGWRFASDVDDGAAEFTVVGSDGLIPVIGLYDVVTEARIAYEPNAAQTTTATLVAPIDEHTPYYFLVSGRDGTTGQAGMSMDLAPPVATVTVGINANGQGGVAATLSSSADLDYYLFTAPAAAAYGDLQIVMTTTDPVMLGSISLWDVTTNSFRASATVYTPGGNVVLSFSSAQAGRQYAAIITSLGYEEGFGPYQVYFDFSMRIPGDADLDGDVDLDDFVRVKNNFGTGTTWPQGDFDGNGNVDLDDFVILKNNFGTAATVAPAPVSAADNLLAELEPLTRRRVRRLKRAAQQRVRPTNVYGSRATTD